MTVEKDHTNDEKAIRELIDRFAKAFRDRDVHGVMAPFDKHIVSFDILPPLQTVGAETFVTHWQQFFGSHQGPIHVEFADVRIATGDDVAFSYCVHRIKGTLKNGQPTDWWLRWTACYRKSNGRWLIVHEHVSVPVDLRSGKALMDLEP
ncbi:MAG: YybH family protein [Thermoanaerobaculia bacterium]